MRLLLLLVTVTAVDVSLDVSPKSIKAGSWVTVSFADIPEKELIRPSTEYICKQVVSI